jgi:lysyl-tRNA synthetase class 2
MNELPTENTHDLYAVRLAKLQEMRDNGFDPFRAEFSPTHTSAEALAAFRDEEEEQPAVAVAGRLMVSRVMGKSIFAKVQDMHGQIQIYLKKDEVGDETFAAFKKLDLGDILGASGALFRTKTGEVTVRATTYTLVCKALRPLPEKWHGLTDSEQIYRQRYLDLIVNQESRQRFFVRSKVIASIRQFLDARGFLEVETPVLQGVAGGAAARPFTTHHNSLGSDFFLRIALELYLKRLLVGGFDRVFEIGKNFRNEGLSRRHNPEFTMLEVYQAYSDFRGMMTLVRDLVQTLCRDVLGTTAIQQPDGQIIELGGDWAERSYKDLIREKTGDADWFSRTKDEKKARVREMGLDVSDDMEEFEVTHQIFEKRIEPTLIQPTFVTYLPKELCPLAKINLEDETTIDVFELCINGQEIAPAYSEQNDPFVQREMFEAQAGEDIQNVDQDFLLALEHGMPPAGGMGIGIDRLLILLTGAESIRDVILFPQMKRSGG